MHALILFCINQHTTFEMPSFTDYKNIIGGQKLYKTVRWPRPRPLRSTLSSQGWDLIYSTCVPNLATLATVVWEIWLRTSKLKMGHATLTKPLLGVVCHLKARIWYSLPAVENCSLWRSRYISGAQKLKMGYVSVTTPLLRVIYPPRASTCYDQPTVKFSVCNSTHNEDTKGDTKCRNGVVWGN